MLFILYYVILAVRMKLMKQLTLNDSALILVQHEAERFHNKAEVAFNKITQKSYVANEAFR